VLLSGPPGLGKTSLAHILARELRVSLHLTSGPALVKKGDLAGLLTALAPRDILFIDEIHRLSPSVEEALYPAMEDFRFDVVLGAGLGAQTMEMKLERFTLVGATTRTGLLASPLRDRFPIQDRLDFYAPHELQEIVERAARKLALPVDPAGAEELARRARHFFGRGVGGQHLFVRGRHAVSRFRMLGEVTVVCCTDGSPRPQRGTPEVSRPDVPAATTSDSPPIQQSCGTHGRQPRFLSKIS